MGTLQEILKLDRKFMNHVYKFEKYDREITNMTGNSETLQQI